LIKSMFVKNCKKNTLNLFESIFLQKYTIVIEKDNTV